MMISFRMSALVGTLRIEWWRSLISELYAPPILVAFLPSASLFKETDSQLDLSPFAGLVSSALDGETPSKWPSVHRNEQISCTGEASFCAVAPDSRSSKLDFARIFGKLKAKIVSAERSLWSSRPRTIGTSSEI